MTHKQKRLKIWMLYLCPAFNITSVKLLNILQGFYTSRDNTKFLVIFASFNNEFLCLNMVTTSFRSDWRSNAQRHKEANIKSALKHI